MGLQPRPHSHGIRWTVIPFFVLVTGVSAQKPAQQQGQQQLPPAIVGTNVNMVSGTKWPGGDPFL